MTQPKDSSVDEDWLDKILEQYWKQRHGMYNANQDDVEVANREAKDAIANKIVELVLKDRQRTDKQVTEAQSLLSAKLSELLEKKQLVRCKDCGGAHFYEAVPMQEVEKLLREVSHE